jgi:hypothetical protein
MVARPGWHRPSECPRTYCRRCNAVLFEAMSRFGPYATRGLPGAPIAELPVPEPEVKFEPAEVKLEPEHEQLEFDFASVAITDTGAEAASGLTALAGLARGTNRAAILCAAILIRDAPTLATARRWAQAWHGPQQVKARLIELFGEAA